MNQRSAVPTFTDIELPGATVSTNGKATQVAPPEPELLPCPARKCEKEFATEGARYAHIRDDHKTCTWEDCNVGPNGTAYVADNKQALAGHVNIHHKGNKPWEHRDNSFKARSAAAHKGAVTKLSRGLVKNVKSVAVPAGSTVGEHKASLTPAKKAAAKPVKKAAVPLRTDSSEHRDLTTPAAKLAAIREVLGEDPRVTALQAEIADLKAKNEELQAHLDLVREALNLDKPKK